MHIPSSEIFRELRVESSGIWFAPTIGTDTHAILLKSPSNLLKSIIKGSQVKIGFCISDTPSGKILTSAVYIYDDQCSPLIVANQHIVRDQLDAMIEILRDREHTPIFFYDELSRNVAEAECALRGQKNEIVELIGSIDDLYTGDVNEDVRLALDRTEVISEAVISEKEPESDSVPVVEVALTNFAEFDLHVIGNREKSKFKITDSDEGRGLEQSVWHLLIDLFQDDIYRSPQVIEGSQKRELTDVLAISEYGTFVIESKSLSVLNTIKDQSMARRAKNIEAHIRKALNQLLGAAKSIHRGLEIYSSDGRKIDFDRNIIPHGIVLLSEMLPAVSWDNVMFELAQASLKSKVILHVLDLRELARLVGGSKTTNILDYYLLQRSDQVTKTKNVLVRVNFIKVDGSLKD